ncbi:MAG: PQQ-binding-like beta-propeller repeat protein [Acidimicrobiia bacterium]
MRRPRAADRLTACLALLVLAGLLATPACNDDRPRSASADMPPATGPPASTTSTTTTTTTTTVRPAGVWADPAGVGRAWGSVSGLLTFRGNPSRTYHGSGPLPRVAPTPAWRFPERGSLCSLSHDQAGEREWCGTGWTGQPAVFEREGRTWVVFGAYDRAVHFLDAATGERLLPDFPTGDLIKGSVTIDPDGYPLVYVGSRDNFYRVIAIDGPEPVELYRLSATAVRPSLWNNDWDGAGLVLDDFLVEGGENGQLHVVELHRGYGPDGRVQVAPELVFHTPGWDRELLDAIGDLNVSIEGSVAVRGSVVYFANSGGLVQGWDLAGLREGRAPARVFRYWTGDDTDATVVIDEDGALYVGVQHERDNGRIAEVGQMIKLDPSRTGDPLVWRVDDPGERPSGVWGTPALHRDVVVFDTDDGEVVAIDRDTGGVRWRIQLRGPTWQSPVVVDDVLLIGDCGGDLHAFDVADTHAPPRPLWTVHLGGCIESTPAVWRGVVYVGTRAGAVHALRP